VIGSRSPNLLFCETAGFVNLFFNFADFSLFIGKLFYFCQMKTSAGNLQMVLFSFSFPQLDALTNTLTFQKAVFSNLNSPIGSTKASDYWINLKCLLHLKATPYYNRNKDINHPSIRKKSV